MTTRHHLLMAGVRNLKEFGYPDVSIQNVATDPLYRKFFRKMLIDAEQEPEVVELLNEIDALED